MKRMDYGSDMDMLQNPTFPKCQCEFIVARRRRLLWWSVWYLFCFRQVSECRLFPPAKHVFAWGNEGASSRDRAVYSFDVCYLSAETALTQSSPCMAVFSSPCPSAASLQVRQSLFSSFLLLISVWGVYLDKVDCHSLQSSSHCFMLLLNEQTKSSTDFPTSTEEMLFIICNNRINWPILFILSLCIYNIFSVWMDLNKRAACEISA